MKSGGTRIASRAQPQRPRGRHRRADAELARLVGRRRDDRARPVARDDDGLAPQLGPAQQLDGRVEGVESRWATMRWRRCQPGAREDVVPGRADRAAGRALVGDEDRARRAEAQALLRGRVRSNSRAPTYGPRSMTGTRTMRLPSRSDDLRAARQRLVGDAERAGAQRAAAAELVAVQAGAVPRGQRRAEDVQPPDDLARGRVGASPGSAARQRRPRRAHGRRCAPVRRGHVRQPRAGGAGGRRPARRRRGGRRDVARGLSGRPGGARPRGVGDDAPCVGAEWRARRRRDRAWAARGAARRARAAPRRRPARSAPAVRRGRR